MADRCVAVACWWLRAISLSLTTTGGCCPGMLEDRVLEHALAKVEGEQEMRGELAAGLPVAEAFAKYGIL